MSYNTSELLNLPAMERYNIAVALWASIEEELPISDEEKRFAEVRLEEYLKNTSEVLKWEDARAQLKKEYGV